jgi:hypothetical protein
VRELRIRMRIHKDAPLWDTIGPDSEISVSVELRFAVLSSSRRVTTVTLPGKRQIRRRLQDGKVQNPRPWSKVPKALQLRFTGREVLRLPTWLKNRWGIRFARHAIHQRLLNSFVSCS